MTDAGRKPGHGTPGKPNKPIHLKLSDEHLATLDRIAGRAGLSYGGVPSRTEAVRWLIDRYAETEQ